MKKGKLLATLLCSASMVMGSMVPTVPAMADAMKVVTLGADLSDEQKNTMLKYFKVDSSQAQIIYVTNQDERDHLSSYVPLEQIGTRTVSCAYVKPTTSGGIKVRTANLNWVTCNMIASSLSTSGVTNCEVVAACPFEVSGTGALTGIQMAYETASGQKLDETKKKLATEEMVVTGNLADSVGKNDATTVINQAKMQVIADNVQNADDIYNIVVNISNNNNVTLTDDEINTIVNLLQQISQQDYDYSEMQETLERVNDNVTGQAEESSDSSDDEDSIVDNVDQSALGDNVIESSTEDPGLAEQTGADTNNAGESSDSSDSSTGIPDATEDGTVNTDGSSDGTTEDTPQESTDSSTDNSSSEEIPAATEDGSTENTDTSADGTTENADGSTEGTDENTDASTEDTLNTETLTEEGKAKFEQAQQFCQGEYQGDLATLQAVMADAVQPTVTLDSDTASKLTKKVLESYLNVLKDGGMSYVPSDTDAYMSGELNMINNDMKKIFSIETEPAADDILAAQPADARQSLYDETMRFFAQLYGEDTEDSSYNESTDEASYEEESYNEEY